MMPLLLPLLQIANPQLPPPSGVVAFVFTVAKMLVVFALYMGAVAYAHAGRAKGVGVGSRTGTAPTEWGRRVCCNRSPTGSRTS